MTEREPDPTIHELREGISEADRALLEALNTRLELVARLKRYKEENDIPFLDPDRERELIAELTRVNPGPLTVEGLREIYASILDLTKREVS